MSVLDVIRLPCFECVSCKFGQIKGGVKYPKFQGATLKYISSLFLLMILRSPSPSLSVLINCIRKTVSSFMFNLYALINIKDIINTFGCTCKEFIGGCWPLGTDFLQKMILQRHHATEAQTYISILMVDAPYFYRH